MAAAAHRGRHKPMSRRDRLTVRRLSTAIKCLLHYLEFPPVRFQVFLAESVRTDFLGCDIMSFLIISIDGI
jgi:hypothetical protein